MNWHVTKSGLIVQTEIGPCGIETDYIGHCFSDEHARLVEAAPKMLDALKQIATNGDVVFAPEIALSAIEGL